MAARSAKEIAFLIFSLVPPFLAALMAASSLDLISLFTFSFLFEPLKALLAVLVTGIGQLSVISD